MSPLERDLFTEIMRDLQAAGFGEPEVDMAEVDATLIQIYGISNMMNQWMEN